MKKKASKSHKTIKRKNSITYTHWAIIGLILVVVIVAGKTLIVSSGINVLGTQTLLAKDGDDSGGSSSGSGSSGSDSSDSGSSRSGTSGVSGSNNAGGSGTSESGTTESTSVIVPTKAETRTSTGVRTETETKNDDVRTEVRLSEAERIRTRVKNGETRIDITSGGIKTRLEYRDDRVIIKAEQEDGTEVELEDDALFKLDQRLGLSGIKVATAGADKFLVQSGSAGAITHFPLSVDLASNTLFINTPAGQKAVTVLPEQAVTNLIAANVVNRLGGAAIVNEVRNNNLSSVDQIIALGEKNGLPVYEITGISDQKLLGFIPVKVEKEVTVSAQTGEVVSTNISLASQILDLLSF